MHDSFRCKQRDENVQFFFCISVNPVQENFFPPSEITFNRLDIMVLTRGKVMVFFTS